MDGDLQKVTTQFRVEEISEKPTRIVDYLNQKLDDFSRSGLKKMVNNERVLINNRIAQTSDWVSIGDQIQLLESTGNRDTWKIELSIRYIDDFIAVVHKPAGMATSGYTKYTFLGALEHNLPLSDRSDAISPQPTHRLDRDTSGLILVARTRKVCTEIMRLFENRRIEKTYRAWVHCSLPVGYSNFWNSDIGGKRAETKVRLLRYHEGTDQSLLELTPITGRKHQLRIHCAERGWPIVGDNKYGSDKTTALRLLAYSIAFRHPITQEFISVEVSAKKGKIYSETPYENHF